MPGEGQFEITRHPVFFFFFFDETPTPPVFLSQPLVASTSHFLLVIAIGGRQHAVEFSFSSCHVEESFPGTIFSLFSLLFESGLRGVLWRTLVKYARNWWPVFSCHFFQGSPPETYSTAFPGFAPPLFVIRQHYSLFLPRHHALRRFKSLNFSLPSAYQQQFFQRLSADNTTSFFSFPVLFFICLLEVGFSLFLGEDSALHWRDAVRATLRMRTYEAEVTQTSPSLSPGRVSVIPLSISRWL